MLSCLHSCEFGTFFMVSFFHPFTISRVRTSFTLLLQAGPCASGPQAPIIHIIYCCKLLTSPITGLQFEVSCMEMMLHCGRLITAAETCCEKTALLASALSQKMSHSGRCVALFVIWTVALHWFWVNSEIFYGYKHTCRLFQSSLSNCRRLRLWWL